MLGFEEMINNGSVAFPIASVVDWCGDVLRREDGHVVTRVLECEFVD